MFKSLYKKIIRVSRYMRTTINKINLIISETIAIEIVPNKVFIFVTNYLDISKDSVNNIYIYFCHFFDITIFSISNQFVNRAKKKPRYEDDSFFVFMATCQSYYSLLVKVCSKKAFIIQNHYLLTCVTMT